MGLLYGPPVRLRIPVFNPDWLLVSHSAEVAFRHDVGAVRLQRVYVSYLLDVGSDGRISGELLAFWSYGVADCADYH